MHQRSQFDRLRRDLAGQVVRVADSATGGDVTIADMLYGTVGSYDAGNQVITTTGTPTALPTGTPAIDPGIKVYDREGAGFSASDTFYAIRQVNVHTDGTHGQVDWVVIPTSAGANKMFLVTVNQKSASQGAGSWVTPERPATRYFDGSLGTTPATTPFNGDIWILANNHHQAVEETNPQAPLEDDYQVPYLPAHAVFTGFYTGATWDPAAEQETDYGSPPSWNNTEDTYGTGVGEIDTVKHAGFYWTAVSEDIPVDSEPTDASIYWDKGQAILTADSRYVYRIDPPPPGLIPGYVTASVTAASSQGGDTPSMSSCSFQCYEKDSGGSWGNGPLLTGVQYNLEEALDAGTLGFVAAGYDGFWLLPGCGVGSGYSA